MNSSEFTKAVEQYRGQWGGRTETGEEMWWSEPHHRLFYKNKLKAAWGRFRFACDVRHFFLLQYLKKIIGRSFLSAPKILDFGCGTGGVTISMAKFINKKIDGYDLFETQIKIANELAQRHQSPAQFKVLNADGSIPEADSSVDAIISGDVLGHVPSIPTTLKDWARVLKKGGGISLFTEANYSQRDQSLMARLARQGMDMVEAVPEHISIFPKEQLEKMFEEAGFQIVERKSANVLHWWFFPKDYVKLFERTNRRGALYYLSKLWNAVLKVLPFYPVPVEAVRLFFTLLFGGRAYGTSYFYLLIKK